MHFSNKVLVFNFVFLAWTIISEKQSTFQNLIYSGVFVTFEET